MCSRDSLEAESLRDALCQSPIWCLPTSHSPTCLLCENRSGPLKQFLLSDDKEFVSKLTKCPGEDFRRKGFASWVHCSRGLCGFANTKFPHNITARSIQPPTAPQCLISASSSSKVPTERHSHEQLLSVYRTLQGKFQGAGIDVDSHRPRNCFLLIRPQPCPPRCQFKVVGRILNPVCAQPLAQGLLLLTISILSEFFLSYYSSLSYKPYYLHELLLKL